MHLSELPSELFTVIAGHLPLHKRVSTLLSLALASHFFYNIIIPHILYTHVRLGDDEDQALPFWKKFIDAVHSKEEGHTTTPISYYIRHLCIRYRATYESLPELQRLIDCDGLPNLVSLTINCRDISLDLLASIRWQNHCPSFQGIRLSSLSQIPVKWIQSELFAIQAVSLSFDLSRLFRHLHTLELGVMDEYDHRIDARGILSSIMPNLRVLILDRFDVGDPSMTKGFWKNHPHIFRLELGRKVDGLWFNDFESGMLPDLRVFKSDFLLARNLLSHVSESLVSLYLLKTYNAQAPYLLRTVLRSGTLSALKSLGIHRHSDDIPTTYEGKGWREDENGTVTEAPFVDPNHIRRFDGNYIMSLAKAAPNLEELELVGDSDDTIDSITSALCRFPKLSRLTLSGPIHYQPFFQSFRKWREFRDWYRPISLQQSYAPASFEQAASDFARGCPTLENFTVGDEISGKLLINDG
ncbi:hypothetical protein H0H93_004771, partial [Arthromyces matolae]